MCNLRWRSQNFHPATWKVVFFPFFYSWLLRLAYSFLPFLPAVFTITKNRILFSTLAITFTFSQCHFPFHSAFLANGKLVVKKVLFVNIFDNTRKRKNANKSESMFIYVGNDEAQVKARLMFALLCVEIWMII